MRISHILSVLVMLCPATQLMSGTHARVRVEMRVPLVVTVEGPAQVVLSPGEVVRVKVRVLANVPWLLDIQSPNANAHVPHTLLGLPGSAIANAREIEIGCAREATGLQTIALVYTLMPR